MLLLPFGPRYLGDLVAMFIVLLCHAVCALILWRMEAPAWLRRAGWPQRVVPPLVGSSAVIVLLGFLMRFSRVSRHFPLWFAGWGRGTVIIWAFLTVLITVALALSRLLARAQTQPSRGRRNFLLATKAVLFGVPMIATGYGVFIERFRISLREQKIEIPGLPKDLDGLRLVQVTDIHLSPFLSEKELARAVDLANEARGHIVLVTGDLITTGHDPLDACLAQLSRLRGEAGVFGCNGNHEVYAGIERYVERAGARFGMRVLRSRAAALRFGEAKLNLAGVDYQNSRKPYLQGAERLVEPDAFNLLLSHNPDVFPVAARKGYQLTLAGHTHGGQVRVEILHADLNVARFFTPYVDGLYRLARQPGGGWTDERGNPLRPSSSGASSWALPDDPARLAARLDPACFPAGLNPTRFPAHFAAHTAARLDPAGSPLRFNPARVLDAADGNRQALQNYDAPTRVLADASGPSRALDGAGPRPQDSAVIFVSRGIGTIGLPARIGAPPEVALLRLCRT